MRTFTSPPALRVAFAAAAAAVLALSACDDDTPAPPVNPDYIVDKQSVSFDACPVVVDGQPVPGVLPDQQTVTIENIGKAAGSVALSITGSGRDVFQIVQDTAVDSLAPGSKATIAIQFKPVAGGSVSAELVIDDGSDATAPVRVTLSGTGSSLPPLPRIELAYQDQLSDEWVPCLESQGGQIDSCSMGFPNTFFGDATFRKVKLRNAGCAPMTLTDILVEPYTEGAPVQFYLDQPATPPSASAPATIAGAGGEFELTIRFEPAEQVGDVGSGNRLGLLTLKNSSSNSAEAFLALLGFADVAAVTVDPSFCDFADPCGVDDGAGKKVFTYRIFNGGNSPAVVDSIALRAPSSGRFVLGPRNPVGATIPVADFVLADVTYTDAPLYVTEVVEVVGKSGGAVAGRQTIRLSGGVQPHLKVVPDPTLDFSNQAATVSTLPVQICDEVGAGDLQIKSVTVQQNAPFFKVLNGPAANTILKAGECLTFNVEFTRPLIGGLQTGTLVIATNDPDYGGNKQISLVSNSSLNQIPVADCKGPGGQGPSFSYVLATLNPKRIKICGDDSYDPPLSASSPAPKGIVKWKFSIGKVPTGVTSAKITPLHMGGTGPNVSGSWMQDVDCDGAANGSCCIELNVDPIMKGEYRVHCAVLDSSGQQSGNDARLDILMK